MNTDHRSPINMTNRIKTKMLKNETTYEIAEIFKILGDNTRIKILYALRLSELSVSNIAEIIDNTASAVSHQLRILKQSKFVKSRKSGKTVFYSIKNDTVIKLLDLCLDHL